MSPNGHGVALVLIGRFPMPARTRFARHTHQVHQLAWASSGTLTVAADARTWVLPTTRALWIPAGVPHEVIAASHSTMTSLYLSEPPPGNAAERWAEPQPVEVTRLIAELILFLDDSELDAGRRAHGETLLLDLLEPVPMTTLDAPLPADPRALEVARAIIEEPATALSLDDWGRRVGASGRTLARLFLSGSGMPFGRWRTLVRLNAALPALAAGEPLSRVSRAVGYETVSAFVAAFRRETGVTPGAYFRTGRPPAGRGAP
ncbi:AraC family transcriptional regulator [Nonomuraea rubra]|uniref:AraC-like DNA-binding protein/quercetin dioxygenase-like cupin family protein n=1 Tax=Nonomuraea rubra TaxID=46180 RepID=A0A7X0U4R1_9ACTN|nr:helix-turn-helix transcriptional regulator [Nonomuraea rubra]MBB6554819.1 AraC-like DNA-binding protein/quercetin dioxygenase-like cupin family protein [Nonomuraea rubra]